jgi:hypothetical protein
MNIVPSSQALPSSISRGFEDSAERVKTLYWDAIEMTSFMGLDEQKRLKYAELLYTNAAEYIRTLILDEEK